MGVRTASLGLLAVLVAALGTAPVDAPAAAAAASAPTDDPLLAPPGRCRGDDAAEAHHRTQRLAMHCLLEQMRRRAGLEPLRSHATLRHSATYKARRIAACKLFTHSPCGDALAVPFREARLTRTGGWRVGENLAWGVEDDATARAILRKWLGSESHRRVLLAERFGHVGVRRRRLRMDGAPVGSVIWVAHLGRRAKR
jgi:uncharacterized protein YkwD